MSKIPPVHELEFLKLSANHAELVNKLGVLGVSPGDLPEYAKHVCKAWFHLGEEHLVEAKKLLAAGCPRATISRAYYAAYNASKAVRYIVQGFVSLKGDDHANASSQLPRDFPQVAVWAQRIATLYENRLRADYDNWTSTATDFTLVPPDAVEHAEAFLAEVRAYINAKFGMTL